MNNLKISVPIRFVCEEIENAGIGSCEGKEQQVQAIVDYILRSAYETHYEVKNMLWDPENAPREEDLLLLVTNGKEVELWTGIKSEVFMSLETADEVSVPVVAYMPYKITEQTKQRAIAAFNNEEPQDNPF